MNKVLAVVVFGFCLLLTIIIILSQHHSSPTLIIEEHKLGEETAVLEEAPLGFDFWNVWRSRIAKMPRTTWKMEQMSQFANCPNHSMSLSPREMSFECSGVTYMTKVVDSRATTEEDRRIEEDIAVYVDNREVYKGSFKIPGTYGSAIENFIPLGTTGWALEAHYHAIVNGEVLNKKLGYDKIFNYRLLDGVPFFFFEKDNEVGIFFDNNEQPLRYDRVFHYQCCEIAVTNPHNFEDHIEFLAVRDNFLYYVEAGVP